MSLVELKFKESKSERLIDI